MKSGEEDRATLTLGEETERRAERKNAESQRSNAQSKTVEETEENKDERLILGSSGVLEEWERICSPQFCLQEVLLVTQMAAFTEGLFIAFFQAL